MGKAKGKADHRADTRGQGFAGVPKAVLKSAAYRNLSIFARAVFLEIVGEFNGYNNGEIVVSFGQLQERLRNSNRRKISASVVELVERGPISVEAEGKWKHHKARKYRSRSPAAAQAVASGRRMTTCIGSRK
jgi:hypothetical protein